MKKASIDSFNVEDTNALFKWICDNFLNMGYTEAKKKLLGYSPSYALTKKVKLADLARIIERYKITVNLEIILPEKEDVTFEEEEEIIHPAVPVFVGTKLDQNLITQMSEITNPEFSDIKIKNEVELEEIKPFKPKIDPSKIPDFFQ